MARLVFSQVLLIAFPLTLLLSTGCNYNQAKQAGDANRSAESFTNYNDLSANILQPKCVHCHNAANASGGVDFSSYASTLSRADVVVSGNPEQSLLYTEVSSGDMPDGGPVLSPGEVSAISNWIFAGAPNGDFAPSQPVIHQPQPTPPAVPTPVASATPSPINVDPVKYSQVQARIFDQACVRCHSGASPKGKVNLSSYAALMASPKKGLIISGAADKSLVFTEISSGDMPPKGPSIAAADVALIRDWINQGAHGDK